MSEKYKEVWVRIRTKHAAGPGDWEFREVMIPSKLAKPSKRAELDAWFKENLAPDFNYELDTHGDGWRGIDWDWSPLPRHRMANRIKALKQQLKDIRAQIKRYEQQMPKLPEQSKLEGNTARCYDFPECGCIKQFKMPDCREPNEWQKKYRLERDERAAKLLKK